MDIDKLIIMANQIGDFFESWPEPEQAATEVASHLRRFWAPQMRARLVAHTRAGGDGLSPLLRKALQSLDAHAPA